MRGIVEALPLKGRNRPLDATPTENKPTGLGGAASRTARLAIADRHALATATRTSRALGAFNLHALSFSLDRRGLRYTAWLAVVS
jgi:hypothetical protein